jgi:hypothetical protein
MQNVSLPQKLQNVSLPQKLQNGVITSKNAKWCHYLKNCNMVSLPQKLQNEKIQLLNIERSLSKDK